MARGDKEPLPVYRCRPPDWLPKAHNSADLGYIGFYPPRPDQEEDVLTETNVKNGIVQGYSVPIETYSAHEEVQNRLAGEDALSDLEDLFNQIFTRKSSNAPAVPSSSFKLPSRVTLNDSKRTQWFADLANPDVPLYKLGKSVPHGAKGHDLLDLLQGHNVDTRRAVWFLRVFGANETAGLRNKPMYNPTQYSIEWANVVTSYIRKQLMEIALPMAPRPGLNVRVTFKGVLADQESRKKWLDRFTYCLELLKSFYSEGLVDNRTFLAWLVQQVATCNLAQLGFVAHLAEEYLAGMLVCRALTHPFAEACFARLSELTVPTAQEFLPDLTRLLKTLIMRTFLACPDAFVNPRMWLQYGTSCQELVSERIQDISAEILNPEFLIHTLTSYLDDVRVRSEAMLLLNLPARIRGSLSSALADIKLLNSFNNDTDVMSMHFFNEDSTGQSAFARKLDLLLTWSVTPLQFGDHRPYVAATLLQFWRDSAGERATKRDRESPDDLIQDLLFDWLDSDKVAADAANLPSIAVLFGQLVKRNLFSYPKYVQRLIARGEPGILNAEGSSRHREFLIWVPLHISSKALITQRKVALYGVLARETPEDIQEREMRKEIRSQLPELFHGESLPTTRVTKDLSTNAKTLLGATRFEQVRTLHEWLIPVLKRNILSMGPGTIHTSTVMLRAYCVATELMAHCKCYDSILEISLFLLEHLSTAELLTAVMQALRLHTEVWAALNVMQDIVVALFTVHCSWKNRGVQNRALLSLMLEFNEGRYLDPSAHDQVMTDYSAFTHALHPTSDQTCIVPDALPEILLLATDSSPDAPSMLANTLWYKYRSASDWAWKVWDNTIASLRQIPSMFEDMSARSACALRYAAFLTHVDQHIPTGSDSHILSWLQGAGRNEIAALSADAWDVVTVVLLHLSIYGALATTTVLKGLVYPAWRTAAFTSSPQQGASLDTLLNAINSLCVHLFLKSACDDGDDLPPFDCFEAQGLHTRRRDVYREPHFSHLVNNIPYLVITEQNGHLASPLRAAFRAFRETLCGQSVFRLGVYRDLDTVHASFEQVLTNTDVKEELHESLVGALKLMFGDAQQGTGSLDTMANWQMLPDLLSPWKLAATSIELRFTLKQLDEALRHENTRERASLYLDKLTLAVFGQGMSSEEADFIADMMKCVCPQVTSKFVNAGLQTIADILADRAYTFSGNRNFTRMTSKAGDILRLLTNVTQSLRTRTTEEDTSYVPSQIQNSSQATSQARSQSHLDPAVQDKLFHAIHERLSSILELLASAQDSERKDPNTDPGSSARTSAVQAMAFLARLLQFQLGLSWAMTAPSTVNTSQSPSAAGGAAGGGGVGPGAWTSKMKKMSKALCDVLFQLALVCGSGQMFDPVAFPLLIDTLYYLLDEYPADPKTPEPSPATFALYPHIELHALPPDMPAEYCATIRALLPYVAPNAAVADLAYGNSSGHGGGSGTGSGDIAQGSSGSAANGEGTGWMPVQNKPWEWTEYLGEPSSAPTENKPGPSSAPAASAGVDDRPTATLGPRAVIRNTTSLPLELFAAHPTGERILPLPLASPTSATAGSTAAAGAADPRVDANLRALQEGTLGESVFKRDWREARVDPERALAGPSAAASREHDGSAGGQHASHGAPAYAHARAPARAGSSDGRQGSSTQSSRVASPVSGSASSAKSRAQGSPATHAQTHSAFASGAGVGTGGPGGGAFSRFTGSSAADPIDVDSFDLPVSLGSTGGGGAGGSGKRKLDDIAEEEEDVQIVEGPVIAAGAGEKRAKTAKTKARGR